MLLSQAGTKVRLDQLGAASPDQLESTRSNSDRKKIKNKKIKLDSDQLGS